MSESLQILKLAVCLFNDAAVLDFQGPMEQFGFLAPSNIMHVEGNPAHIKSKIAIEAVYLAPTADPVKPATGPLLLPNRTYDSVGSDEQFDMLLVPGGGYWYISMSTINSACSSIHLYEDQQDLEVFPVFYHSLYSPS